MEGKELKFKFLLPTFIFRNTAGLLLGWKTDEPVGQVLMKSDRPTKWQKLCQPETRKVALCKQRR